MTNGAKRHGEEGSRGGGRRAAREEEAGEGPCTRRRFWRGRARATDGGARNPVTIAWLEMSSTARRLRGARVGERDDGVDRPSDATPVSCPVRGCFCIFAGVATRSSDTLYTP